MANPETVLQGKIMIALSEAGHRGLRNNSGAYKCPKSGRLVRYGVGSPGGSDLIGWSKDGRFLAVEVKTAKGRATKEQLAFIAAVRASGGYAGIARSVEDAIAIAAGEIRG